MKRRAARSPGQILGVIRGDAQMCLARLIPGTNLPPRPGEEDRGILLRRRVPGLGPVAVGVYGPGALGVWAHDLPPPSRR